MKYIVSSILHSKIATRQLKCSECGVKIDKGRVYVKTNWGRYCESCADGLEENPLPGMLSQVLLVTG